MKISKEGTAFIAAHEGFVSRAYRCPAGVLTIGYGFTMRSRVFADHWRSSRGRDLNASDTIDRNEADKLLGKLVNNEYGAAVTQRIGTLVQHQWDGAASVSFNCGPGALGWRWAQALAAGNVAEAARLLRTTATTANGRQLAGLVRRRAEESRLIELGAYAHGRPAKEAPSVSATSDEVRAYQQQLVKLGYDLGPVGADGIAGPRTKAAVEAFQGNAGLKVDGIVGPATRAALIRALDEKTSNKATAGGGAAGGAGTAGSESQLDPALVELTLAMGLRIAVGALVVAGLIWGGMWLWRNRGRVTGRRVPT